MSSMLQEEESSEASIIYKVLTEHLHTHRSEILEIEILPSNFPALGNRPILHDGTSLAISKGNLVKAFVVARRVFFDASSLPAKVNPQEEQSHAHQLAATRILLLFDPEHLTAANFCKQYLFALQKSILSSSSPPTPAEGSEHQSSILVSVVHDELSFLSSLLTSPLARHTKSPTLWYHRFWVLQNFYAEIRAGCSNGAGRGSRTGFQKTELCRAQQEEILASELDLVMKAGEKHPKNYYAWLYARRLFSFLNSQSLNPVHAVSTRIITKIHTWSLSHPSDTSGWSYMLYLLSFSPFAPSYHFIPASSTPISSSPSISQNISMTHQTINLLCTFHWSYDSIWAFFRTVLASKAYLPEPVRRDILTRIVAEGKEEDVRVKKREQNIDHEHKDGDGKDVDDATTEAMNRNRMIMMKRALRWIEEHWEPESQPESEQQAPA
ncbi:MAG: hypothetical protein M1819_005999 [Sarea resinae]|nr:MAG: hypothetical protein M1819_005999 [Sarea resinae]